MYGAEVQFDFTATPAMPSSIADRIRRFDYVVGVRNSPVSRGRAWWRQAIRGSADTRRRFGSPPADSRRRREATVERGEAAL